MRAFSKLIILLLVGCVFQALAADEPKALSGDKTKALLSKSIGKIVLPEETLEKRIVALRAIASQLGLDLTVSEGVEAVAKSWKCPTITIQEGSLALALKYTVDVTKLFYRTKDGGVHLLMINEIDDPPIKQKGQQKGQQDAPSNGG